MRDWTDIESDEFIDAYNAYPPNRWIRFAYKHFSKNSERKNMKVNNLVTGILLGLFGFGFLGTILGWSKSVIGTVTIAYGAILTSLVLFLFIAVWMNNRRIKKIAKKLNVSIRDYNHLVRYYL